MTRKRDLVQVSPLSNTEQEELDRRVKRINETADQGRAIILDELYEIHRKHLYRKYPSFQDFCEQRLTIGSRRAYQLLKYRKICEELARELTGEQSPTKEVNACEIISHFLPSLTGPIREAHTDVLAQIPEGQRAPVVEEAEEMTGEDQELSPGDMARIWERHQNQAAAHAPPAEAPKADAEEPKVIHDSRGQPVPENLQPIFARDGEWTEALMAIKNAEKLCKKLLEAEIEAAGTVSKIKIPLFPSAQPAMAAVLTLLGRAKKIGSEARPHAVCDTCKGERGRCTKCWGWGYALRSRFRKDWDEEATPEQIKLLRDKGEALPESFPAIEAGRRIAAHNEAEGWSAARWRELGVYRAKYGQLDPGEYATGPGQWKRKAR